MAENVPNLGRNLEIQVHEAPGSPNKSKAEEMSSKTPHNGIVHNKRQREILESSKRKKKLIIYKRPLADFYVCLLKMDKSHMVISNTSDASKKVYSSHGQGGESEYFLNHNTTCQTHIFFGFFFFWS